MALTLDDQDVALSRTTAYLDLAKKRFDDEKMGSRILRLAKYYRSDKTPEGSEWLQDYVITVNMLFPTTRVAQASLYSRKPEVIVRPRRSQDSESAKQMEMLLNYLTRHLKWSKPLRRTLTRALLFHYGILKVGWDPVTGLPWLKSIPPSDFRGDPTMPEFDPEEGSFCAFRFVKTVAQLKALPQVYDPEAVSRLEDKIKGEKGSSYHPTTTTIPFWECYLRDPMEPKSPVQIVVKSEEYDLLVRGEDFKSKIGLPVISLIFHPAEDQYFPISVPELWVDQQKEKNAIRSQQLIHSSRSNSIIGVDLTKLPPEEREKLESDEPEKIIGTEGSPDNVIKRVEGGSMPADIYQVENKIDNDVFTIAAVGSAQLGGQPNTPSASATQVAVTENNLRLRSSDRQEVWDDMLETVYTKVGMICQEKMSEDQWVQITEQMYMPLGRDQIQGVFSYTMSFGSTLPVDKQTERATAETLFKMFKGDPLVDQVRLYRNVMNRFDIRDVNDWVKPPLPSAAPAGMPPPGMPPPPGMGPPGGPPMMNGAPPMPGSMPAAMNLQAMLSAQHNQPPLDVAGRLRAMLGNGLR